MKVGGPDPQYDFAVLAGVVNDLQRARYRWDVSSTVTYQRDPHGKQSVGAFAMWAFVDWTL